MHEPAVVQSIASVADRVRTDRVAPSGEGLDRWYDWLREQSARSPRPPA